MKEYTFKTNLASESLPIEKQRVLCMGKEFWFIGYYLEGQWYRQGFIAPEDKVVLWYEIPKHFKDLTPGERIGVIAKPWPEKSRRRFTNLKKYRKPLRLLNKTYLFLWRYKMLNSSMRTIYRKARTFILNL